MGNRTSSHLATAQVHDAANRLLEDSTFAYTYDQNGNLTSKTNRTTGEVTTYTYDAENQLVRVDKPGLVAEHRYDALGRRIAKVVNGVSTRFVYDNEDLIAEVDASNIVPALYVHGPGIDEPLAMFRSMVGVSTFVFHADGLGSITALTDTSGNLRRTYTYDSFGRLVTQTGSISNPYTYTSREFDPDTGLLYYRNRYYNADIGRFLTEDKLNLNSIIGSPLKRTKNGILIGSLLRTPEFQHRYVYVNHNPIGRLDPFGLWYVDVNLTGGYWLGLTGGIMVNDEGIFPYLGGGFVFPAGINPSVTFSTSNPSTGWNVGLQGGYWGGGQVGYGFGQGGGFYWEAGFVTPGVSATAFYVFGPFRVVPDDLCPPNLIGITP